MPQTMIEKVAKIIQVGVVCGDSSWDEIAHNVIVAMREPTREMRKAGSGKPMLNDLEEEARIKYQWMIDAALEGK